MSKTFSVYIMASRSGTLYIGVTNDLARRVYEHKHGLVPGFTSKYRVTRLVYCQHTDDIGAAIDREKQLKRWSRRKKLALVESVNPKWQDLSAEKTNKSRLAARDPSTSVAMTEKRTGMTNRSQPESGNTEK
jgi:putative endonuclease